MQVTQYGLDFRGLLAQSDHQSGFGEYVRRVTARKREHVQRLAVARLRAHPAVKPRHRLDVVIEDVRRSIQHPRDSIERSTKVRRQYFHSRGRKSPAHLANGFRKMMRSSIFEVIAIHAG